MIDQKTCMAIIMGLHQNKKGKKKGERCRSPEIPERLMQPPDIQLEIASAIQNPVNGVFSTTEAAKPVKQ